MERCNGNLWGPTVRVDSAARMASQYLERRRGRSPRPLARSIVGRSSFDYGADGERMHTRMATVMACPLVPNFHLVLAAPLKCYHRAGIEDTLSKVRTDAHWMEFRRRDSSWERAGQLSGWMDVLGMQCALLQQRSNTTQSQSPPPPAIIDHRLSQLSLMRIRNQKRSD